MEPIIKITKAEYEATPEFNPYDENNEPDMEKVEKEYGGDKDWEIYEWYDHNNYCVVKVDNELNIWIRSWDKECECPRCKSKTSKVHSYFLKTIYMGTRFDISTYMLYCRKFKCENCGKIFDEHLFEDDKLGDDLKKDFIEAHFRSGEPYRDIELDCYGLVSKSTIQRICEKALKDGKVPKEYLDD